MVGRLSNITLQSTLLERIKEAEKRDPQLRDLRDRVLAGTAKDFTISDTRLLKFQSRICVPMDSEIRKEILKESYPLSTRCIQVPLRCIKTYNLCIGGRVSRETW